MSQTYHTDIAVGAAANASVFNAPLGTLDAAIVTNTTAIGGLTTTVQTVLDSIILGGAAVTLTNGAASAAQKVVTVDSSAQFVAGCYVEYTLVGGVVERNTVDTVDSSTQITLITNIGTGGIADNSPVAVIPVGFYNAQQNTYHVANYGAAPGAAEATNTAAINAAISAAKATKGTVILAAGTYAVNGALDLCDTSNVHLVGAGGHYATILECHNTGGAAIEIIGSKQIKIENIRITGDATDTPSVGIWTGRSTTPSTGSDTSQIWCERVFIDGAFTVAAWYNTGCESVQLFGCITYMTKTTCKAGVMHDWENTAGTGDTANALTPEHTTISIAFVQALGIINHSFLTCAGAAVAFSPVYIVNETGPVQIRNTYVTAYGKPIYYMLGSGIIEVFSDYVEGTPTYIVHGDFLTGAANDFTFHLSGCNGPTASAGSALWFDDSTIVKNSLIERCNYIDDLRFYDIQGSRIEHFCDYSTSTDPELVIAHQSSNCYFEIEYEDTYSNADPKNTTVIYNSNNLTGYTHLPGLAVNRNNIPGATGEAVVQRILRASKSWSPGAIGDDGQAATYVDLVGVLQADAWFCMAHYAGISGYAGWDISAVAGDSVVGVSIVNRSGGSLTPTGTLSVVAWKITAA